MELDAAAGPSVKRTVVKASAFSGAASGAAFVVAAWQPVASRAATSMAAPVARAAGRCGRGWPRPS
ncbi:hypothetical protein [Streptomyces sp. NBC_00019]|uniref:hypothetical protein n=1 Tax=Streptomyces sp. NBC_00019 TaxID=2975623 RepID=UPI003253A633